MLDEAKVSNENIVRFCTRNVCVFEYVALEELAILSNLITYHKKSYLTIQISK